MAIDGLTWTWVLFLVFSAGIVLLSWKSLHNWRSHGFYRFFAFEAILALILLNIEYWFHQPFSVRQILSWLLLLLSLFLAVHGFMLLPEFIFCQGRNIGCKPLKIGNNMF